MFHERVPDSYEAAPRQLRYRRAVWTSLLPRRGRALMRLGVSSALALSDVATIFAVGLLVELAYFYVQFGAWMDLSETYSPHVAAMLSAVFLLTNLVRDEYSIENYLNLGPHLKRTATLWLMAWAAVLVAGFATKTTNDFSRVIAVSYFAAGLPVLLGLRWVMVGLVRRGITPVSASVSRVHLVGYEEDIADFHANNDTEALGLRVVGTSYLRHVEPDADAGARQDQLCEDLDLAVSVVRFLRPDDVFVLVPWSETADIERCIEAFLRVPAALHLRPGTMMDRFPDLRVVRVGRLSGLNIGRRPLTVGEVMLKRAFDLAAASVALVLLAPLLLAVALLIKLDSPGPIFFRQRRYGFNQQPFDVYKFRSMRAETGAAFRQARRDDERITRLGRVLRKTNIDELPQLFNVIGGQMSLVGPRPHALAHDRSFERRIALYARRHNVKPGITGWAQVNGLRGETLTDEAMQARVQADLHYIDNWSVFLDVKILVQTVLSPRAYRNAF